MKFKNPENWARFLFPIIAGTALAIAIVLVYFGVIETAMWLLVFSALLLFLVYQMDQNDQLKKENLIFQAENRAYLTKYGPVDR